MKHSISCKGFFYLVISYEKCLSFYIDFNFALFHSPFSKGANMKKLLKNDKGQSVLEYIILTSLIGIFCLAGIKTFGDKVNDRLKRSTSYFVNKVQIPSGR